MMQNNMFSVTPVTQVISLEPGQVYEGTIIVANPVDSTADFNYKVAVAPYGVIGEDYTVDMATRTDRTQIVDWIKIGEGEGEGTVRPNEKHKVPFTITVPVDAIPGAQYAAIAVTQNDEVKNDTTSSIQNVFEIASVIYADVAGVVEHDARVLENEVPGFSLTTPITISALLENKGGVHESASMIIKAHNVITGEEILPKGENLGQYEELILPDTTRRVDREVQDLPMVGVVYVEQTIYYNGQVSSVGKNVVICPLWVMGLMVVVLVGIIWGIVKLFRRKSRGEGTVV